MDFEKLENKFRDHLQDLNSLPSGSTWNTEENWHKFQKTYQGNIRYLRYVKYAAAFIIFLLSVYIFINFTKVSYTEISTGHGEKTKVRLGDGCEIWINSNTTIKYPSRYTNKKMTIEVEGEAYFEITGKRSNPVVIVAGNTNSYVYESSFNIRAFPSENNIEITTTDGNVELGLQQSDIKKTLTFAEGEHVSVHRSNKLVFQEQNTDKNIIAWKTGMIEFKEVPLYYVLRKLEKLFETKIMTDNQEINSYIISLKAGLDDLPSIMNEIARKTGYNIKQNETGYLICKGSCWQTMIKSKI